MKTQMPRFLTLAVALSTIMTVAACAKSSDGSTSTTGVGTTTTSSSTVNAQCTGFAEANARFGGRIATYYDTGSNFIESQLRVRVTQITSSFDTSGYNLEFFRWKSDSAGNASLDSTPLSFTIYYNSQPISGSMTSIDSTAVSSIRNSSGIGTSSQDFFAKTTIVVSGVDNSWQVLKTVLYNGPSVVGSTDSLMPLFLANPNTYAASHPALLNQLHPFSSIMSNGYTDSQYVALSNQSCFQ